MKLANINALKNVDCLRHLLARRPKAFTVARYRKLDHEKLRET